VGVGVGGGGGGGAVRMHEVGLWDLVLTDSVHRGLLHPSPLPHQRMDNATQHID